MAVLFYSITHVHKNGKQMKAYSLFSQWLSHRSSLLHTFQFLDMYATSVSEYLVLFHIQAVSWCSDNTQVLKLKQSQAFS